MFTIGCTGEAAAASLTIDLAVLAIVDAFALAVAYQTSCFCPATLFAGLKGSSLLVVADMARSGVLVTIDGRMVLRAGVTTLRMAMSVENTAMTPLQQFGAD
jgi:hypothetical protein